MHIHHAERNSAAFTGGCGRPSGSDATFALRRRALLEAAGSAAAQAPATPAVTGKPVCPTASVAAPRAPDSTYDVAAMRREKGSVSILTQDGDTVKIRFRNTAGIAVQADSTSTADSTTSTTSVHAFASGRMQVEVNGELDADELKAIGDLMEKVDSLATQFFDGDTQAAFSAAADLGFDSGEIAGFALRLSVKESVRATLHAPAVPDAAPANPAAPAPAPAPAVSVAPLPSEPTAAPAAPVEASGAPADATDGPAADAAPPATAGSTSTADPAATLQNKLGGFLNQVLEALSSASGAGRAEFSMKWKLQVMVAAVQSAPAASTSEAAGTRLATDSLAGLAATSAS